jgi:hypothetical protein
LCSSPSSWADEPRTWSIDLLGYQYITPDEGAFFIPVIMAETDVLHVEMRYNYEDFETGSLWIGPVFTWEGDVSAMLCPLLGVAIGRTVGMGPGLEASVDWRWLHLYTEGQLLFDVGSPDDSYTYLWTDITADITDMFQAGLVVQRTRYLGHPSDVSAGPFLGVTLGPLNLRAHLLGPGSTYTYGIITIDIEV